MVVRPVHIEYELFSAAMKRDQHSSDGMVNARLESATPGPLSDEIDLEHLLRRVIAGGHLTYIYQQNRRPGGV